MARVTRFPMTAMVLLLVAWSLLLPAPARAQTAETTGTASAVGTVSAVGTASAVGTVAAPGQRVRARYLVCDPRRWPGANPRYPYSFPLSVRYRTTDRIRIRASVRSIQRVINTRIWGDQLDPDKRVNVVVDGSYGRQTRAAVKAFQKANKLAVTGRVGPRTWRTLASYCGSD